MAILNFSLVVTCLLLVGSVDLTVAQSRLDTPTANLEISNAVPLELIKKIALEKSKETWGLGAIGEPVPLCDLNGDVVVYMVPFSIGKKIFPTYDEILQGVTEGREMQNLIKNGDVNKAREMHKKMDRPVAAYPTSVVISEPKVPALPPIPPVRPDGSISRRKQLEETRDMERYASQEAIGADEFGTIIISANYDMFPVLAYFYHLAPYYTNFDLALDKTEQAI